MTDSGQLARLWEQGRQQLEMVRRQSIVYDLYSHKHTHAMVSARHRINAGYLPRWSLLKVLPQG